MVSADQPCYTIINAPLDSNPMTDIQFREAFQKGTTKEKVECLKRLIHMMLTSGEKVSPSLLITVIQYVMPDRDHQLKKLLLIFWEIVPKYGQDGKLLHEFILVCDAYRKDLMHPNEYIRGSTLRFLCKLKEAELLEPLMPAIRECLSHRHAYVKRNAVLAIFTIYKNFDNLIPDAPELIGEYLENEKDMSCKRNAFMMLIHVDQDRAVRYLSSCIDQVPTFGDILQLVIVELIYKVCHNNPGERARFIRCVYNLLTQASSNSVKYEAASTLVTLSNAPSAVKAVSQCYIDLILKEADNNVKLIVLGRLIELKDDPMKEKVLQDLVMDILRILSATDLDVKKKTLDLALDLVTSRTVSEMVLVLKKEVIKCQAQSRSAEEGSEKYRQLLVKTLHQLAIRFPDTATIVIPTLTVFLTDKSDLAATDVLVFLREAMVKYESLRPLIISKLLECLSMTPSAHTFRIAMWILGEFCTSSDDIQATMTLIRQNLGELPIVDDELRKAAGTKDDDEEEDKVAHSGAAPKTLVTEFGTYATQSAFTAGKKSKGAGATSGIGGGPNLRGFLMKGEFFVSAAIGSVLVKLALRYCELTDNRQRQNRFTAEAMFIMSTILRLGLSGLPEEPISAVDAEHLQVCVRILADRNPKMIAIFTEKCRVALDAMLAHAASVNAALSGDLSDAGMRKKKPVLAKFDDAVPFSQLLGGLGEGASSGDMNLLDLTLNQALTGAKKENDPISMSKLSKVTQLTGFSDPIYAEAYVNVNQYDIVLDIFIVNQTPDTLQNLQLELATQGDLKLVEKPVPITLGGHDFTTTKASIKVASTENGVIFGNIVYDIRGATGDRSVVVINDIHINIMDYITPATVPDHEFRDMWYSRAWENRVDVVGTKIAGLQQFVQHVVRHTNMRNLTRIDEDDSTACCGFLSANLYAESLFGEAILVNLCLEKDVMKPTEPITGHMRIRTTTEGLASILGDELKRIRMLPYKKSDEDESPEPETEEPTAEIQSEDESYMSK